MRKNLFLSVFFLLSLAANSQIITTIAGTNIGIGTAGDGGPAVSASVNAGNGIVVDNNNNIYFSEGARIRKIEAGTHIVSTIAGTGELGYTGDNGPALNARIAVLNMAIDADNNLYLVCGFSFDGTIVRMIEAATNDIFTIAGGNSNTYTGDGDYGTNTKFTNIRDIAVDRSGNIFLAESNPRKIRKITMSNSLVSTVAGTGAYGYSGDDGPALDATLQFPNAVAVDSAGNVYYFDSDLNIIRKIDAATGVISRFAGTANAWGYAGDGGLADTASFQAGSGKLSVDNKGNLFITDQFNQRIRKIDTATHIITTITGGEQEGFSGDGGLATQAQISITRQLFANKNGDIYFYDNSARIRKIDVNTGIITTVAGNGNSSTDGTAAMNAMLNNPGGITVDPFGNIYIEEHGTNKIRKIDAVTNNISTIAGTGETLFGGDGGLAVNAGIKFGFYRTDRNVAIDAAGNIYVNDNNSRIRKIDAFTKIITTVAGTGSMGYSGDGGQASAAQISAYRFTVDWKGNIFLVDTARLRKIDVSTGIITTIAGNGLVGSIGDGGLAIHAQIDYPSCLFTDKANNIYVGSNRLVATIRKIDGITNIITTIAGTGTYGNSGDGGLATNAMIDPAAIYADDSGYVYIASTTSGARIRKIDPVNNIINTIAGTGSYSGYEGDEGPALNAKINPYSMWLDKSGNIYIAQLTNGVVRKITYKNPVTTRATGNWSDPNTWTSNTVPLETDDVILFHNVQVDINASCKSLATQGHTTNVNPGKNLTINGR